jgi:threonylcarbamoyladenosine tRNA methylthiotransferase MtaB
MRVCFETFGCRLNRAEALEDEARYLAAGCEVVSSHREADLIVIRACSVTARAQKDCEKLIHHLEKKYPGKRLAVVGCIKAVLKRPEPNLEHLGSGESAAEVAVPTRTARAYLKVQDGCSGACTFCIVPQFRGKSVSVGFEDVLGKARRFIEAGYHELVVTGCNLALYASGGKRLPELIAALAELDENCRVRLGSVEPGAQAMELIHVMAEKKNMCRFLHVPVQSGSNRILSAMKRPYKISEADELFSEAVRLMPLVGLGCDLMTGFPDENEMDFRLTKGFLKRHVISKAHIFPFSPRPGTAAAAMPNVVPEGTRKLRAHELLEAAEASRKAFARRFTHKDVEVVIERDSYLEGWTSEYLWFKETKRGGFVPPKLTNSRRKELMTFRVRSAHNGVLYGERRNGGRDD